MRRRIPRLPLRSRGLLLIAAIWFIVGIGVVTGTEQHVDSAWHQALSPELRAALWWTASFTAVGAAIDKRDGRRDWLALAICTIPPMIRLTSYAWAWIVSLIPGDPPGYPRGWLAASVYGCMVALVWLVAAIPDDSGNGPAGTASHDGDEQ